MQSSATVNSKGSLVALINIRLQSLKRENSELRRLELDAALQTFLKLPSLTNDNYKFIAKEYRTLGDKYFNAYDHHNAETSYLKSIQQFTHIFDEDIKDDDYRLMIDVFLNLSDAYWHQHNEPAARQACQHAIEAFKKITLKDDDEKKLRNPEEDLEAFKAFHSYYERDISDVSYINSTAFINHQTLLASRYNQNADNLNMASITFAEPTTSTTAPTPAPTPTPTPPAVSYFACDDMEEALPATIPMPKFNESNDTTYRETADQLYELAKGYFFRKQIKEAIATLLEAKDACSKIKNINREDRTQIELIEKTLSSLTTKTTTQTQPTAAASYTRLPATTSAAGIHAAAAMPSRIQQQLDEEELLEEGELESGYSYYT